MAPMGRCAICREQTAKYKCPKCITPYCSLACWKTHQQNPCSPPTVPGSTSSTTTPQPTTSRENGTSKQYEVEGPESIDKVSAEKLALLGKSEALKSMLGNRHLRAMLEDLYQLQDPVKDLEAAMQEPIFVEFAQECLNTVEGKKKNGDLAD